MPPFCTAFAGTTRIAHGALTDVALRVKAFLNAQPDAAVLVFDNQDSNLIELDLRGSAEEIVRRLPPETPATAPGAASNTAPNTPAAAPDVARGPGRPKLGVVAREVTLLPRHWEWLAQQPGGASVALRKLVDEARRVNENRDQVRRAQDVAYRFMSAIGGDQPQFEEAARALFAADGARFAQLLAPWPHDLKAHLLGLAAPAFAA